MRLIPTRVHGFVDYLVGLLLLVAPWGFRLNHWGVETWLLVIGGVVVLLQAILTDFEVGLVRKLPMKKHLSMDLFLGLFLAVSPWVCGFADIIYLPFVAFGVFFLLFSLTTHTTTAVEEQGYTVFEQTEN